MQIRQLLFLCLFVLSATSSFAQLAFKRETFNNTYTPITVASGATTITFPGSGGSGAYATAIPIGFTFNYLAQNELHQSADIEANLRGLARDQFATVSLAVLERVVAAFKDPSAPIPEDDLLLACGNNRTIFKQLLRYQIVLPVDFWHPTEFTLSPDLLFMSRPSES